MFYNTANLQKITNHFHAFHFLLPDDFIKISFQFSVGTEIPKRQAADLVEIIPIIIKFGNMFLSRLVLGVLRVVQVEGINLAYQEGFDTGLVALLGDGVGFFGDSQLLRLVIKMFHQQENILIEVYLFLANL